MYHITYYTFQDGKYSVSRAMAGVELCPRIGIRQSVVDKVDGNAYDYRYNAQRDAFAQNHKAHHSHNDYVQIYMRFKQLVDYLFLQDRSFLHCKNACGLFTGIIVYHIFPKIL